MLIHMRHNSSNRCNMDCFFCHNEGMANPRRPGANASASIEQVGSSSTVSAASKPDPLKRKGPSVLSKEQLLGIMNAFTLLGGKQINVTGMTDSVPRASRGVFC